MNSRFLKLGKNDLVKGLLLAILTAIVTALYNGIETGTFAFTWEYIKPILMSSLGAGLAYILKNFLTNSDGKTFKSEPKNNM